MKRTCRASGFALVEALVATGVMAIVVAAVFQLFSPAAPAFQLQPEVSEMQQRLRIAVDQLTHDLMSAGAGSSSGLNDTASYQESRSLLTYFAPILPYVQSSGRNDDGQGTFSPSRITLLTVPLPAAQTALASDLPAVASHVQTNPASGCRDPLCGFRAPAADGSGGTTAVVYDATGSLDSIVVTAVDVAGGSFDFQPLRHASLSQGYAVPSRIVELSSAAYFWKTDTNQLMRDDSSGTNAPFLDNVVGLEFEYFGDPRPPAFVAPNTANLSTTYGPPPPGLNVAAATGAWPAGENCMWTIQTVGGMSTYVPRLPTLAAGSTLVPLPAAVLTDGPWCPDGANANRYDADLFRIRKVRVTLRLQTGNSALRGAGSLAKGPDALFAVPGTALALSKTVPDRTIRFDVSPRNMNLAR